MFHLFYHIQQSIRPGLCQVCRHPDLPDKIKFGFDNFIRCLAGQNTDQHTDQSLSQSSASLSA